MPTSLRLWSMCISANLGGLLVGLHLALFSGILEMPSFTKDMPFDLTPPIKSVITSALVLGFIAGAIPAGPLCDKYGRRVALMITAALFLSSTIAMAFARKLYQLVLARLVAGLGYAVANVTCTLYTAEVAPPQVRGILVNLYQLLITVGIFASQSVNALIWEHGQWTTPVWLATIPAALMLILVFLLVTESHVWETRPSSEERKTTLLDVWKSASGRKRLVIGCGLAVSQQLTGINAIIFFGPALVSDVLKLETSSAPFIAAAIIGAANVLATVASLGIVERFGRRVLLLTAGPPMISSLLVIGAMRGEIVPTNRTLGVGALLLFVISFAIAYGPVPFLIIAEIFPVAYKGTAMGFCSLVLATACLGLGAFFLPALKVFGGYVFGFFAISVAVSSWFVFTKVPETRNLTLDEVDELLS
ncbi:putative metabolite transport protein CsbC [Gracilariopsis chorda]|uniref:Putative metabolite transport protein CsbC n=1 Tax=Gracilariopsis chorda TaxID=448386 RepID=A0A2V3J4G7_9FLOR|nr:putative metabolite transport protein CsbC [Gracilariopsis chorda]|eukprot:PXF48887.1 putative metabolite transport protein CsbC [Gracilariopsis chorda]